MFLQEKILLVCMRNNSTPAAFIGQPQGVCVGKGCCRNDMNGTASLDQVREAAGVSRDTTILGGVIVHCGKQEGRWCWLYNEEKPLSNFYPMWLLMVGKNQACQYHPPPKRKEPRGLGRWTTREKSNQDQASQHWAGRGASRWESHHREMPSKPPLYAKPKSTALAGRGLSEGIPHGSHPSYTQGNSTQSMKYSIFSSLKI